MENGANLAKTLWVLWRGLVGQNLVGGVGDDAVEGRDSGHDPFPKGDIVLAGDEVGFGIDDCPGFLFDLVFELIL